MRYSVSFETLINGNIDIKGPVPCQTFTLEQTIDGLFERWHKPKEDSHILQIHIIPVV